MISEDRAIRRAMWSGQFVDERSRRDRMKGIVALRARVACVSGGARERLYCARASLLARVALINARNVAVTVPYIVQMHLRISEIADGADKIQRAHRDKIFMHRGRTPWFPNGSVKFSVSGMREQAFLRFYSRR